MWLIYVSALLLCVLLSALFSGSETGMYCVNRLKLRLRSDRGRIRAVRLQGLFENEQRALAVILIGTNLANYLTTIMMAMLLGRQMGLSDRQVEFYTTLMVTPLLFVFGEVLPKNLFQLAADRLLYPCSLPLAIAERVFHPIVWLIERGSAWLPVAGTADTGGSRSSRPGVLHHRDHVVALLHEALAVDGPAVHGAAGRRHDFVDRVLRLSETPISAVKRYRK